LDDATDCTDIDDDYCSNVCRGLASLCGHAWSIGAVAGCYDGSGYSCACAPGGG
jgi:hypothetical protein